VFCVIETNSYMDSRKTLICGNCGKKHTMFSYSVRKCLICENEFPNVFFIIDNKSYRVNYHFHGTRKNYDTIITYRR
jgi:uncharacterized CHY-type Zn-finger protein